MSPHGDEVAFDCVCGGRLVITGWPESLVAAVDTLVRYFMQTHRDHGTGGVRELRLPVPSSPPALEEHGR